MVLYARFNQYKLRSFDSIHLLQFKGLKQSIFERLAFTSDCQRGIKKKNESSPCAVPDYPLHLNYMLNFIEIRCPV